MSGSSRSGPAGCPVLRSVLAAAVLAVAAIVDPGYSAPAALPDGLGVVVDVTTLARTVTLLPNVPVALYVVTDQLLGRIRENRCARASSGSSSTRG